MQKFTNFTKRLGSFSMAGALQVLVLVVAGMLLGVRLEAQCTLLNETFSTAPPLSPTNVDGAWYPDRYPPAAFTNDAGRLKISISAADGAQLRPPAFASAFYNTQGRKFNQCGKCVTVAKADLYIPADWATNFRRSDLWATAYNASDAISFYPIIGFRNVTGTNPQMSVWNGSAWIELGAPSGGYDKWYTLEFRINGTNIEYLIDGAVVATVAGGGSVYFGNIIMQAYNFNDNTLGASYDPGPNNSYDAFWDNLITTGTGGKVVTNLNTGLKYCTIQSAINDPLTLSGHVIEAAPGTYNENVTINKADLTLRSSDGKAVTTIVGTTGLGTILIQANGFTLGGVGQGFKIVGYDSPSPGLEYAAVYIQGVRSNITIRDNEIVADGEAGLLSEFGNAVTSLVVSGNIFSGKTFVGPEAGDCGFANQFTAPNVPRQLITIPTGSGIMFTSNQITGTAGSSSSFPGCTMFGQGNTLVTIDANNATIRGNTFAGTTTRFAHSLRVRGNGANISCNTFDNSGLGPACVHIFFTAASLAALGTPSTLAGVASANVFINEGAYFTGATQIYRDAAQVLAIPQTPIAANSTPFPLVTNINTGENYCSIQSAIDDPLTLSGHTLSLAAGTYIETVTVTKSLSILGPNATINPCDGMRVPEAILMPPTSQPFYDGSTEVILMEVQANNVTVKGLTFDGDNPALTNSDSGPIDAADGLDVFSNVGGLLVENNIFKNLNEGGVTGYPSGSPAQTNNTVVNNRFENIPGDEGTGYPLSGYGIGVLIYNNFYTNVEDNCMEDVRIGVQTGNYYLADPGNSRNIRHYVPLFFLNTREETWESTRNGPPLKVAF